jgi:Zn-dependent protease/CBS domain-containing protein
MFGRSFKLFTLFGFDVKIDWSWIVIAVLITWSLAQGYFPHYHEGLSSSTYWWMGVFGALGLFASIVFHEFSHSLVARRYGLPMKGITLFIFGGVAEMQEEPANAKTEFLMAFAGPASSIVIGGVFYGIYRAAEAGGWPVPVTGIFGYLALINWVLAAFNLLPAFPLDGGRVLRSALWKWKGDLRSATRQAAWVGSGFGFGFIGLGVLSFLSGSLIGGIWWFMIGIFLRYAAQSSYQQVLTRRALEGDFVRDFMQKEPVTVPPDTSIRDLVENYVYKFHFKMFPVSEDGRLTGCISTRELKDIPRERWDRLTVGEASGRCSPDNTVSPGTNALQALNRMSRTGKSRLMVVEGDRLVGVLALKDILNYLSTKLDLEGKKS